VATSKCRTGWGVVAVHANSATRQEDVVVELFGSVVLDASSNFYMGAEVGSNNTAELTAIGEALLWVSSYMSDGQRGGSFPSSCVIRYDSEYAAKSVLGMFNGVKNRPLILTIRSYLEQARDALRFVGCTLEFVHVKGHSGQRWNDRADKLATAAANSQKTCTAGRYAGALESVDASSLSSGVSRCIGDWDGQVLHRREEQVFDANMEAGHTRGHWTDPPASKKSRIQRPEEVEGHVTDSAASTATVTAIQDVTSDIECDSATRTRSSCLDMYTDGSCPGE
jgi:ribonuclease HI